MPAAAGIVSGLVAKVASPQGGDAATATVYAAGHLTGLGLAWWGQKRYPQARSFLRGAMWGEGIVGSLAVMGAASMVAAPPRAAVQATAAPTRTMLHSLAQQLTGSGFVRP